MKTFLLQQFEPCIFFLNKPDTYSLIKSEKILTAEFALPDVISLFPDMIFSLPEFLAFFLNCAFEDGKITWHGIFRIVWFPGRTLVR